MEKHKLSEYLDAEIPLIRNKKGVGKLISLLLAIHFQPSYDAIFMIRYCFFHANSKGITKPVQRYFRRKLVIKYGIFIEPNPCCTIGIGLSVPHPNSIVIGAGTNIGDNCVIYQNVTIGAKKRGNSQVDIYSYPKVGDNCVSYAGAVVLGAIDIEDGTQVGANSVLICNTEKSSIYAGVPAVRKR